jgi:hypothetical protein
MRWAPRGFGGDRSAPEQIKREGWRVQGVLVVDADDERLTWPERQLIRQLGDRLYGRAGSRQGVHHE